MYLALLGEVTSTIGVSDGAGGTVTPVLRPKYAVVHDAIDLGAQKARDRALSQASSEVEAEAPTAIHLKM